MIVNALYSLLITLLNAVYNALPEWSIDPSQLGGESGVALGPNSVAVNQVSPFYALLTWCGQYNTFIPIDQIMLIIGLTASLMAAFLAYKMGKWIIGLVRG